MPSLSATSGMRGNKSGSAGNPWQAASPRIEILCDDCAGRLDKSARELHGKARRLGEESRPQLEVRASLLSDGVRYSAIVFLASLGRAQSELWCW
jgi:hypothetical protein